MAVYLQRASRSIRTPNVIWLPYGQFNETVKVLRIGHLWETHDDLVRVAKMYAGRNVRRDEVLDRWHALFFEHLDSFYTFGLYACSELKDRNQVADAMRFMKTWQKRWAEYHKHRRLIRHPDWPNSFLVSMRERLVQLDRAYSPVFDLKPKRKKVEILWPT